MGYADGPRKMHGMAQFTAVDVMIAFKLDLAYFDLRAFADNECKFD